MLIATGLLMFGFVAYQLWGTGLEYAQAQTRLEDDFAALVTGRATTTTTTSSVTTTVAPVTVSPATGPAPTAVPATTAPATAPPATAPPAVAVPDFAAGDVMARIEMSSIDVDTYVVSGVQPGDLKKGPGHYPETPQPGQLGNSAIAGHRTTYGQPFFRLDRLAAGDEVVVTTVQGRFVYRVTGREVVGPGRSDVVATVDPTVARLTLTTCDPKYTATNRLIVYADLDLEASNAPPQAPILETERTVETLAPAPSLPDDPVVASTPTPTGTGSPPASSAAPVTTARSTSADGAAPGSPDDPGGGEQAEIADAFAHGWFSDDAAFAQVAVWGLVVSAIAVGAWFLSRRVGRNWIGALVGIVPFAVALYFFFQNVNRLLPAAL